MRQSIESGGFERRQGIRLWRFYGAGVVVLLAVACQVSHSEGLRVYPVKQGGSLSGAGVRGGSAKGAPSHAPGYLGILFQNLTDEQDTSLHVKSGTGVEVVMVDHDGPAGKAGLQPHDVIIRLNGQNVTGTECLHKMIHDAGVGAPVSLTVYRGGRQIVVNAQLAYRGEVEKEAVARMVEADPPASEVTPVVNDFGEGDPADPVAPDKASRSRLFLAQVLHTTPFTGLMLEAMEPQLAGFFGAPAGVGMLVETVAPNSPAAAAGLRAGDVILKADSVDVKSNGVWVRELHETRGRGIVLVVLRDKQEVRILLIPDIKKHSMVVWPTFAGALPVFA
jgi:predicted metalloprotease with PDZ domain